MQIIDKLTEIFCKFPGIGPRQARRFVYYLLTRNKNFINELETLIKELHSSVTMCRQCFQHFDNTHNKSTLCNICIDTSRQKNSIAVVSKDTDIEPLERSGSFKGTYFVLGGIIPILDNEPEKKVRIKELLDLLTKSKPEGLNEVILAMNWNPEGEYTSEYIEKSIKNKESLKNLKITHLGKGLSMGTELEYADPDTLKNALRNRS